MALGLRSQFGQLLGREVFRAWERSPGFGASPLEDLLGQATGAWRAATRRPNGRDLVDLSGNGRDLLMGGQSSAYLDGSALVLPGVAGNYASVPDEAAFAVTDLDVAVRLEWGTLPVSDFSALMAQGNGTASTSTFLFRTWDDDYRLHVWTTDGVTAYASTSTNLPAAAQSGKVWVRATVDSNDGAGNHAFAFYWSTDDTNDVDSVSWTQLGSTSTVAGTFSINNSTAVVEVGTYATGTSKPSDHTFHAAALRDGIDGTTVLDIDFADGVQGASSFTATSGQTVTVNSTTTTNDPTVLEYDGTRYMFSDGATSNDWSTPDGTEYNVTDLDLRADVALDDWTPASEVYLIGKWLGSQKSFILTVNTTGTIRLFHSADGSASLSSESTAAPSVSDGDRLQVRATLDVDDGSGNHVAKFYTRAAGTDLAVDTGWSQLGTTVTTAGTTSIFDSTTSVTSSINGGTRPPPGKFYAATIKDGGTTVLDVDFTDPAASSAPYTTVTAATGQTVTLNGRATLVTSERLYLDGVDDFLGVLSANDAAFDIGTDDVTVVAVARHAAAQPVANSTVIGKKSTISASSGAGWLIYNSGTNANWAVNASDGTAGGFSSGSTDADEAMVHAFTRSGATFTAYEGATQVDQDSLTANSLSNSEPMRVGVIAGVYADDMEFFGAAIFKGRVLTPGQIAQVGRELAYRESSVA